MISGSIRREVRNGRERKAVSMLRLSEQVSLLVTEPQSCWDLRDEV